jgi:SAM-dependent methyltransferase
MSCPVCGHPAVEILKRPRQLGSVHMDSKTTMDMRLMGCHCCDFVWNATAFDQSLQFEAWMASAYNSYQLLSNELHNFPLVDARAQMAESFLNQNCHLNHVRHVLEVGSNRGDFLAYLKSCHSHINVMGVDSSKIALTGVPTIRGDIRAIRFEQQFDLVIVRQVLEHIPEPNTFLIHLASLITDGGYLLIEVPDLENDLDDGVDPWVMEHVGHYSENSLYRLASRAGLTLLNIDREYQLMALFIKDPARSGLQRTVAHGRWDRIQAFKKRVLTCQSEWLDLVHQGWELCFYGASNVFLAVSGVLNQLWKQEWTLCSKSLVDDYASKHKTLIGGIRVQSFDDFHTPAKCIYIVCAMYRYHRQKMLSRIYCRLQQKDRVYAMWTAHH